MFSDLVNEAFSYHAKDDLGQQLINFGYLISTD